jgi:hypothetical protein
MWIVGAFGVVVLGIGVYILIDAQREVNDLQDKLDQYPHDLRDTNLDVYEYQLLGLWNRDLDKAEARRGQGVMFVGIGFMILGLAYLLAPGTPQKSDEVPSFVRHELTQDPPDERTVR